jgi:antitoxin FitA
MAIIGVIDRRCISTQGGSDPVGLARWQPGFSLAGRADPAGNDRPARPPEPPRAGQPGQLRQGHGSLLPNSRGAPIVMLALLAAGGEVVVAAVSIRDLDDSVREKLRVRAARHGRSMEAEMRAILTAAVRDDASGQGLFSALVDRFADLGGVEFGLPPRATPARAADPPE